MSKQTLDTDGQTTSFSDRGQFYYFQAELNGGTGTLKMKIGDATVFADFDDNVLEDGVVKRIFIPRDAEIELTKTGATVVYITQ